MLERVSREAQSQGDGHDDDPQANPVRSAIHARRGRLEDHRGESLLQGPNAAKHRQSQRVCTARSGRQADEEGKPSMAGDPGAESLRWASNALGNVIATMGGHRLVAAHSSPAKSPHSRSSITKAVGSVAARSSRSFDLSSTKRSRASATKANTWSRRPSIELPPTQRWVGRTRTYGPK